MDTFKRIDVKNLGDTWTNRDEVEAELKTIIPYEPVEFYCWEGISIGESGLLDFINSWQSETNYPTELITVFCVNKKEHLPYRNTCTISNMIWGKYQTNWWKSAVPDASNFDKVFGLFVGRDSIARNFILYECYQIWQSEFLFSRLENTLPHENFWEENQSELEKWVTFEDRELFKSFWSKSVFGSIDKRQFGNHLIGDQMIDAAVNLLSHYGKFGVELVLETMTLGHTFFPTEKTVRPIVGNKPFLTYATRNYLKYLRELGFRTFGDFWDESYDEYEGVERWNRMKYVIQHIIDNPGLISNAQPVINHNKQVLLNNDLWQNPLA